MIKEELLLRRMEPEDIPEITTIYAYYVEQSTVTFDLQSPQISEMREKLYPIIRHYPAWVCSLNHQVIGYAYAHPWKTKPAYAYTLETTLYLHPKFTRQGIGHQLMNLLIQDARNKGIHTLIACITSPNLPSEKLHFKLGFKKVSHFSEVGLKFGKWLDVADYELVLAQSDR